VLEFLVVAFCASLLGFGTGILARRRSENRIPDDPEQMGAVTALLEQARWLPVVRIGHQVSDSLGYPDPEGVQVVTVELDGGIRMIGADKAGNGAFLEYAGFRIGLKSDEQEQLGQTLRERLAEQAMADASVKLLGA